MIFMVIRESYQQNDNLISEKQGGLNNHQVAANFMNTVSDDLHEYYNSTMKMRNYAGRLIKLTRIVQKIEVKSGNSVEKPRFCFSQCSEIEDRPSTWPCCSMFSRGGSVSHVYSNDASQFLCSTIKVHMIIYSLQNIQ